MNKNRRQFRSTTILSVRHNDKVALGGDGQVSLGSSILKHGACKIRRLHHGKILTGFSGASADAITLYEKFEGKLEQFSGNLLRAAVELAKDWRTDRALRRLEALLLVADNEKSLVISGTGDIIEPDDGIMAIGSGGSYALAAARALVAHSSLDAPQIVDAAMRIAADICLYTNQKITVEIL